MNRARRILAALVAAFVFLGAFTIAAAPAHADVVVSVTTAPPAPTLDDQCQAVDPDPSDLWTYLVFPDPVGNSIFVDATVPEGYVIGDTGNRLWSSVASGWEFTCTPAAVEPAPVDPAPVAPVTPADPGEQIGGTLPATGPEDTLPALAGVLLLGLGVLFLIRRTRTQ